MVEGALREEDMSRPMVGRLMHLPGGDEGVKQTLRRMSDIAREYSKNPTVIRLARAIVHSCPVKDFACEARALFEWVRDNIRWTRDVYGVETLATPVRTLEMRAGDCLPAETLLLNAAKETVKISEVNIGDLIIGASGKVTCVLGSKYKGVKPLLAFYLSNDTVFRCTPNHRLFAVVGEEAKEVRAREISNGDKLLSIIHDNGNPRSILVERVEYGGEAPVFDIETDSRTIYLPEYDIVVHNCDDLSTLLASLYLAVGFPVRYVVIANLPQHSQSFSHVFVQVDITGEGDWVSADPSQPTASFGWETPVQYRRMVWAVV